MPNVTKIKVKSAEFQAWRGEQKWPDIATESLAYRIADSLKTYEETNGATPVFRRYLAEDLAELKAKMDSHQ